MNNRLAFLWAILLVFAGCSGSSNSFTAAPSSPTTQVATVRINQVLLRAIPSEVTRQRFTGFDSSGLVRYGPETRDKAAVIELENVSTAVVRLQIEYLQGETVIGLGSVALELTPGETVEINDPPFQDVVSALSSLQVTPGGTTIANGSGQQFTVIGTFADNTQLDLTSSATWSSSNPAVATIAPGGLASAVSPGETTVTAAIGPVTDSTTLTVSTATISSIQVTPNSPVIAAGTTQDFMATATLSNGLTQDVTTSASWTSSNTSAATVVSNTGVASGVAAGQSQISAAVGNVSGQITLTVSNASVTSLVVSPGNPTLADGTTQQFQVIANFTSGPPQDVTSSAVWTSSDDSIATISPTGLATAVSPGGPITIAASFGGQSADTNLTVTDATIQSIAVTPANPAIADGTDQQFIATATLTDGSPLDVTGTANWTSGTTATATIAPGGLASAVNPGQTLITATSNSVSGSTTLTVTAATVESIAVTPANPTLANGASQQFTATATFSDNSTQNVSSSATWMSGTTSVATITNPGGVASVVADTGTSQISATFGGQTGSTTLTASDATVESITVTPNPAVLAEGQNQQFTATANYSDGSSSPVTGSAMWSSNDTNIATVVSNSGLASTAGIGNTQITATFGGQTGSATVVVTQATLESLAINPPQALSAPGTKRRYQAIGNYSDGSTQDLTSQVTWTSTDTDVTMANDNLGPNLIGQASIRLGAPYTSTGTPVTVAATLGTLDATSTLYLGAFAYIANYDDTAVSILRVDPATGTLSSGASMPVDTGTPPTNLAVHPTGRFLYVVKTAGISVFRIDPTTGELTDRADFGSGASFLTVEPTGRFAYSANGGFAGNVSAYAIDGETGALSQRVDIDPGTGASSVAVDPTGRFAYVANTLEGSVALFTIDPDTGGLGNQTDFDPIISPASLAFHPSGRFLYVGGPAASFAAFDVDASDGTLTNRRFISATPVQMAADPTGRFLYTVGVDTASTFTIDPLTGTPGNRMNITVGSLLQSVQVDPTGRFAYMVSVFLDGSGNNLYAFSIDPSTGALSSTQNAVAGNSPYWIVTTP